MRLSSSGLLLLVLGGCASKARPPVVGSPVAEPPVSRKVVVAVAPPPVPAWTDAPAGSDRPVRALAWEELPIEDPPRLVRDLADAKACVALRTELARFVATRLDRVPPSLPAASVARVRSGLENAAVPGCAIGRRDCGNDGKTRQWCWSEGVMDSSTVLALARRELGRVDSTRADRLVQEIFRERP